MEKINFRHTKLLSYCIIIMLVSISTLFIYNNIA